jgi:hypothetical protein
VRTTLTLDPDVEAKLKSEMRRSGKSFKELVNELLRFSLLKLHGPKPISRFEIRAQNMGLRPGYSLDCISRLIEDVEGPFHR